MNWYIVGIAYLSLFVLGISDNIRGPLFPDILRGIQLNDSQGAWFFGIASLMSFVGSLLFRPLIIRWGSLKSLRVALIVLAVGLLGIGVSHNYWRLIFSAGIYGLGYGGISFIQNLLVKQGVPAFRLRQAMSGLHTMYGVSSILAPTLIVGLYRYNFSWNSVFLFVSVFPILLFFGIFMSFSPEKQYVQPTQVRLSRRIHFEQLIFAFMVGMYVISEVMISTRLALYMRRVHNMSAEASTWYVALFFASLMAGRLLFTVKHFKWSSRNLLIGLASVSFLFLQLGLWWQPIFLCLTGFTMAPFFPAAVTYATEIFGRTADSAINYVVSIMSLAIVIMHLGIGYITDLWGIHFALQLSWVALIPVMIIIWMLEKNILSNQHQVERQPHSRVLE